MTVLCNKSYRGHKHTHLSRTPSARNNGAYGNISVGTVYRYGSIRMPRCAALKAIFNTDTKQLVLDIHTTSLLRSVPSQKSTGRMEEEAIIKVWTFACMQRWIDCRSTTQTDRHTHTLTHSHTCTFAPAVTHTHAHAHKHTQEELTFIF